MPFVDRLEPAVIDVGINLRRANAGMTEHFLQRSDLRSPREQVCRETVTQRVWANVAAAADAGREALQACLA